MRTLSPTHYPQNQALKVQPDRLYFGVILMYFTVLTPLLQDVTFLPPFQVNYLHRNTFRKMFTPFHGRK